MPMGRRSVTLREDCCCCSDCSLAVVNPLLVVVVLPLLEEDKLLLLLLFSLLLACCCWSVVVVVVVEVGVVGRWATAVSIEVLAKRRASSRTWKDESLLMWPPPTTERLSVTPPVRSARPSSVVPYFNASYEPCNLRTKITNNRKGKRIKFPDDELLLLMFIIIVVVLIVAVRIYK